MPSWSSAKSPTSQSPEFVARAAIRSISDADTRSSLSQIKAPTLVIAGEEDRVTPPRESEILAKGIPNSKLVVLPNERHSYFFSNPGEAHRIIREFIKD